MPNTQIIPILLSKDLVETISFYKKLGFEIYDQHIDGGYLITSFDDIELHFQLKEDLDIYSEAPMCYVRTDKAHQLYDGWLSIGLPSRGMPRMDVIGAKPWGMYEFAVVDPSGNLIRIGKPLEGKAS